MALAPANGSRTTSQTIAIPEALWILCIASTIPRVKIPNATAAKRCSPLRSQSLFVVEREHSCIAARLTSILLLGQSYAFHFLANGLRRRILHMQPIESRNSYSIASLYRGSLESLQRRQTECMSIRPPGEYSELSVEC